MKLFMSVLAAMLAAGLQAVNVQAQESPVQLRFSHWLPGSHPLVKSSEEWAASINKASNGTLNITIFPAQQLGKAFDHYNMARDGVADITHASPGYEPGRFPVVALGELPFMLSNASGGSAALDSWYRDYAAKEMSEVKFCLSFVHDPGTFHSKKKIVVPADVAGLKVRPSGGTVARLVTLLGGNNVQASAAEARDMIEKGVADALTFPWESVFLFGIDKVVKYHLEIPLYTTVQTFVFNKSKLASMSDRQKRVIEEHCTTEWAGRIASGWGDFEHRGIAKMKSLPDHEVTSPTLEQVATWKKANEPLVNDWMAQARKAGYDPSVVLGDFRRATTKYNSGY